jgi:hypothetical protein
MSKEQKEKELFILKNSKKEDDYLSPVWKYLFL